MDREKWMGQGGVRLAEPPSFLTISEQLVCFCARGLPSGQPFRDALIIGISIGL